MAVQSTMYTAVQSTAGEVYRVVLWCTCLEGRRGRQSGGEEKAAERKWRCGGGHGQPDRSVKALDQTVCGQRKAHKGVAWEGDQLSLYGSTRTLSGLPERESQQPHRSAERPTGDPSRTHEVPRVQVLCTGINKRPVAFPQQKQLSFIFHICTVMNLSSHHLSSFRVYGTNDPNVEMYQKNNRL